MIKEKIEQENPKTFQDELLPSLLLAINTGNNVIYTGYYANMKNYSKYKCYSISNSKPKGIEIDTIKEFVPDWNILKDYKEGKIDKKIYENLYLSQLNKIDWNTGMNILRKLLENKSILLCYEQNSFCHRHILAKWLEENTVIELREV